MTNVERVFLLPDRASGSRASRELTLESWRHMTPWRLSSMYSNYHGFAYISSRSSYILLSESQLLLLAWTVDNVIFGYPTNLATVERGLVLSSELRPISLAENTNRVLLAIQYNRGCSKHPAFFEALFPVDFFMQFSTCLALLFASLVSVSSAQDNTQPSSSTDDTQYYNQYQGVNLQDSIINELASQLNFTLSSGNPSVFFAWRASLTLLINWHFPSDISTPTHQLD